MSLESAHEHRTEIMKILNCALTESYSTRPLIEVNVVASLVRNITRTINHEIRPFLNNHQVFVSASGVFIHGRPLVTSNRFPESTPKSVELGDLLLLTTYIPPWNHYINTQAMLIQAKIAENKGPKPDNMNQLYLYGFWPEFEYVRSGPDLNGKRRFITGPFLYEGAKYLFIGPKASHFAKKKNRFWTYQPTYPDVGGYRNFKTDLYNFIFCNTGKSFVFRPPHYDIGWDQMITDLINVTAKKVTPPMGNRPRGKGYFITGESSGGLLGAVGINPDDLQKNNPDIPPDFPLDGEGEGGGISIIEFVIRDRG